MSEPSSLWRSIVQRCFRSGKEPKGIARTAQTDLASAFDVIGELPRNIVRAAHRASRTDTHSNFTHPNKTQAPPLRDGACAPNSYNPTQLLHVDIRINKPASSGLVIVLVLLLSGCQSFSTLLSEQCLLSLIGIFRKSGTSKNDPYCLAHR